MREEFKRSSFKAEINSLPLMMDWIQSQITNMSFSPIQSREIELAMEEALVNIISYAYQNKPGEVELICFFYPDDRITFKIIDQGISFNPLLKQPAIDSSSPLEEREEGGLGILLIRKYMDEVYYERRDASNILCLTKKVY